MKKFVTQLSPAVAARVEEVIGYRFRDRALLSQAFLRESCCNEARQAGILDVQSNEVLEFCGDSVLGTAVITLLMERCGARAAGGLRTRLDQGDFSVIKSNLTDKRMLSARMRELGLGQYLLTSEGDVRQGVRDTDSVLEDLFESLVGAVYFDSGNDLPTAIALVGRLLDVDAYLVGRREGSASPKNDVQEWCARYDRAFSYELLEESGPEHDRRYLSLCRVEGQGEAKGVGRNRKEAERNAAAAMYLLLARAEEEGSVAPAGRYPDSPISPKNDLQEWCARNAAPAPTYTVSERGDGRFVAVCRVARVGEAEAEGRRKKEAEQAAAAALMARIREKQA